jgi:hypothetical protein
MPVRVAGALQDGSHGYIGGLEKHVVPVSADAAMADVLNRHERASRGGAHGIACVDLREAHAVGGDAVDVGSLNALLAVAAEVTIAEVVGEYEYDVGLTVCGLRG